MGRLSHSTIDQDLTIAAQLLYRSEGYRYMMAVVESPPVFLYISNKGGSRLPCCTMLAFPSDLPLMFAVDNAMLQDSFHHIRIIFRDVLVGAVVVQDNLLAVHMWKVHLETIGMDVHNFVRDGDLVATALTDSVQHFTRTTPERVKLVSFMREVSNPNAISRFILHTGVGLLESLSSAVMQVSNALLHLMSERMHLLEPLLRGLRRP